LPNQDKGSDCAAACTNACTKEGENGPIRANRLHAIADLLADLPEAERRDVIAELAPTDRAVIARLLIHSEHGKGTS